MIKKMKIDEFLKTIPYDNVAHANCKVTFGDNEHLFFAYVKLDDGTLLRTFDFKDFWTVMQKLDDEAEKIKIRVTVKTPLFRKSTTDELTSFDIGM